MTIRCFTFLIDKHASFFISYNTKHAKSVICFSIQDMYTAFHLAAYKGETEIVKLLIGAGVDVNLQERVSKSN